MKINLKWFWAVGLSAVVIGGSGAIYLKQQSNQFRSEPVLESEIIEAIYGIGKVEAVRRFHAKAGVPSGIADIPFKEGALVKKGDLLVDFVGAPAIRAPFAGVITRINFELGETVFAGNVVLEMIDPSQFDVRVVLDQRAALKVRRGQKAKLSFEGLRDQAVAADIRAVYSSDAQFTVLLSPKDLPETILEGMTADVSIEVARKPKGLTIPVAAVQKGKVTRLRNSQKKDVPVKLGLVNNDRVELSDGDLAIGDSVLVKVR